MSPQRKSRCSLCVYSQANQDHLLVNSPNLQQIQEQSLSLFTGFFVGFFPIKSNFLPVSLCKTSSLSSLCSQKPGAPCSLQNCVTPVSCSCSSCLFCMPLVTEHPGIAQEGQCLYSLLADGSIILLSVLKTHICLRGLLRFVIFLPYPVSSCVPARTLPSINNVGYQEKGKWCCTHLGPCIFYHRSCVRQTRSLIFLPPPSLLHSITKWLELGLVSRLGQTFLFLPIIL